MKITPDKIIRIIEAQGLDFKEKRGTIHTVCPACGESDKLSISKRSGATICYRGKCSFGRQWFEDWLAMTANVSRQEAARMIADLDRPKVTQGYRILDDDEQADQRSQEFVSVALVAWPPEGCFPIAFPECERGQKYLASRGISVEMAERYGIVYNLITDRVVLPIMQDGKCYGWQARATFDVDKDFRMRNNEGYSRGTTVMFFDRLEGSDHAIMCEGPFDALKFDRVGGNVATMGTAVTDGQLDLILSSGVTKIYLAFDDDFAASESMTDLVRRIGTANFQVYRVTIPRSCIERCAMAGKKADFGECSFEECEEAFKNAMIVDQYVIL
jgi:hypothetical protein